MRRGLIPVLAVLMAGCGGSNNPGGPAPPAPGVVELKATTVADFDAVIAAHKGKVVYIDCWFLG